MAQEWNYIGVIMGSLVRQTSSGLLQFIRPIDPICQCHEKAVAMGSSVSDPGNV